MHGDVAYCLKHGHDWETVETEYKDFIVCKCRICGMLQVGWL